MTIGDKYIAWCRYTDSGSIVICSSNDPGTFKVFREAEINSLERQLAIKVVEADRLRILLKSCLIDMIASLHALESDKMLEPALLKGYVDSMNKAKGFLDKTDYSCSICDRLGNGYFKPHNGPASWFIGLDSAGQAHYVCGLCKDALYNTVPLFDIPELPQTKAERGKGETASI